MHSSSGIRTHTTPVFKQAKTVHALDRAAAMIGRNGSIPHSIVDQL
jgi:hypothetical protein